jgi:hypothetical protein
MKYTIILLLAFVSCTNNDKKSQSMTEPLILTQNAVYGQTGYKSSSDKIVIPFGKYAVCLTDTFRTHAIVMTTNDNKWVVIDRQENILYEIFSFDNGPDYPSEGLFRIVKDNKIGFANASTYAVIISPQFDCAFPFENGKAKVSNNCTKKTDGEYSEWTSNTWEYVDKKGVLIPSNFPKNP